MDQTVRDLLAEKQTDTKLYRLAQIASNSRVWNYELPTLTVKGRFTKHQQWSSSQEFQEVFYDKFQMFKEIDMRNIAVLGGAIFDILHFRQDNIHDIDLFIVGDLTSDISSGLSEEQKEREMQNAILRRAEKFMDDVYDYLAKTVTRLNEEQERSSKKYGNRSTPKILLSNYISDFKATRNGSVITFNIPTISVPVQLVLAPNASIAQLLQRVDIDCTAIAFYEGELLFTSISKFCFENSCAIVSKDHARDFYEQRLQKYFSEKGMDLILPDLDIAKIPKKNLSFGVSEVIDLPYLAIVYEEINGNKILASRLVPQTPVVTSSASAEKKNSHPVQSRRPVNAYGSSGYGSGEKQLKHSGVIIHENIIHLLHDLPQKFQFYGEGKFVKDVLLAIPKMTERMITNTFENISDRLRDGQSSGVVDVTLLEKYFVIKSPAVVLEETLIHPLQERARIERERMLEGKEERTECSTLFDEQYDHMVKQYFQQLVQEQIEDTKARLKRLNDAFEQDPEKFRIVASLALVNRNFSADEWYGQYHL